MKRGSREQKDMSALTILISASDIEPVISCLFANTRSDAPANLFESVETRQCVIYKR
jgi:hypothetical protein